MFACSTVFGAEPILKEFEEDHDDYSIIMFKALMDRLAEALAEKLHEDVRKTHWGYSPEENLTRQQLVHVDYDGIRPAPGYPSQPDHTEKKLMWKLMNPFEECGIELTENLAMDPASSVSGLYFSHKHSEYFSLGEINKDQVEDYAERKGMELEEVEGWLSTVLSYK